LISQDQGSGADNGVLSDRDTVLDRRADSDGGTVADPDVPSKGCTRPDTGTVGEHTVMINGRSGVDDAMAANTRAAVDDCPGHYNGSTFNLDMPPDLSGRMDEGDEPDGRQELGDAAGDVAPVPVVADGHEETLNVMFVEYPGHIENVPQNGVATEQAIGPSVLGRQADNAIPSNCFDDVDDDFRVA
jgi:hypothetical protein